MAREMVFSVGSATRNPSRFRTLLSASSTGTQLADKRARVRALSPYFVTPATFPAATCSAFCAQLVSSSLYPPRQSIVPVRLHGFIRTSPVCSTLFTSGTSGDKSNFQKVRGGDSLSCQYDDLGQMRSSWSPRLFVPRSLRFSVFS